MICFRKQNAKVLFWICQEYDEWNKTNINFKNYYNIKRFITPLSALKTFDYNSGV